METRSNVVEQPNGINSRVATDYGMVPPYILFTTTITPNIEGMAIQAILAVGGMLLLTHAAYIDLTSRYEADNVHKQQLLCQGNSKKTHSIRT